MRDWSYRAYTFGCRVENRVPNKHSNNFMFFVRWSNDWIKILEKTEVSSFLVDGEEEEEANNCYWTGDAALVWLISKVDSCISEFLHCVKASGVSTQCLDWCKAMHYEYRFRFPIVSAIFPTICYTNEEAKGMEARRAKCLGGCSTLTFKKYCIVCAANKNICSTCGRRAHDPDLFAWIRMTGIEKETFCYRVSPYVRHWFSM